MGVQQHLGFFDRREAGALLATKLSQLRGSTNVVVLAVAPGGVPVAHQIARALDAPLDVLVVRKLLAPGHPEIAMGAVAAGGVQVLDERVVGMCRPTPGALTALVCDESEDAARRERVYRGGRAPVPIQGRIALLVDDGAADCITMRAAATAARRSKPAYLVVTVPIGSRTACEELREIADEVICPYTPQLFSSVLPWFAQFPEPSDTDVRRILEQHATRERHQLSA